MALIAGAKKSFSIYMMYLASFGNFRVAAATALGAVVQSRFRGSTIHQRPLESAEMGSINRICFYKDQHFQGLFGFVLPFFDVAESGA
jgi:hypothetical protein